MLPKYWAQTQALNKHPIYTRMCQLREKKINPPITFIKVLWGGGLLKLPYSTRHRASITVSFMPDSQVCAQNLLGPALPNWIWFSGQRHDPGGDECEWESGQGTVLSYNPSRGEEKLELVYGPSVKHSVSWG